MDNIAATAAKRAVCMMLLLFALPMVFGCAGGMLAGGPVAPKDRILFDRGQSGEGVYNSGTLTVHYKYNHVGKKLHLAGRVQYGSAVDSLDVYVPIIDASGNILTRYIVYYSGYRIENFLGKSTFQEDFDLPPEAAGFSFSYSVQPGYMRR